MFVAGVVSETLPAVTDHLGLLSVAAGLVVFVLVYILYTEFYALPGKRFARTLGSYENVAILMHPNPDPDAMASALAAQSVAESVDTEASLYYPGQIRHHENRAFETVLDLDFTQIQDADDIEERHVVLVDHNEPRGFEDAATINPVAVVDHHPGSGEGAEFTDVRTGLGACATIFSKYLDQLGREPIEPDEMNGTDPTEVITPDLASGLVYGIQSDTDHLTNGCSADEFEAASFLYGGIDRDKLDRIANPEMDVESLEIKAKAITEREVNGVFAISDVGEISNGDAIPQAADELRRLEGINAVVVLGTVDNQIQLSGRSTDDRVHIGKVLETAVESVPMASAGGHARMGGGQIPLDHMAGLASDEGLTREELKERLFDAMNGEL